jgi:AAA15 family ATPase/GTPase
MLAKFKVSNFKSFNQNFILDLTETNGYNFNTESINKGIVNNALIYGYNGVGKSNLGLALFDIIEHLTDQNKIEKEYQVYLNAYNKSKFAEFHYEFLINSAKVIYEYRKSDYKTIIYEKFSINDEDFVVIDRTKDNNAIIKFKGAETLKTEIDNSELSILKYIKNNSVLEQNSTNQTFKDFFKFIEGMLFFRSLRNNMFLGLEIGGGRNLFEDIIEKKNVEDFERFLNEAGIECKLKVIEELDKKILVFDFDGNYIPFEKIASHGTSALTLFYFWFQRIREKSKVTFLFIDEFDAFYHHELSALIVKELRSTGVQFILTTHNTTIITNDLLRPDCYFLMNKDSIRSLSKSTQKELREAHNIEKMYKAGTFDVN